MKPPSERLRRITAASRWLRTIAPKSLAISTLSTQEGDSHRSMRTPPKWQCAKAVATCVRADGRAAMHVPHSRRVMASRELLDWNDVRFFLAVARGRSMARAARLLGVDQTTVGRRISALE